MKTRLRFAASRSLLQFSRPGRLLLSLLHLLILYLVFTMIAACEAQPETGATQSLQSETTPMPTNLVVATSTVNSTLIPLPSSSFVCNEDWQSLPVIPTVTDAARALYGDGLADGNDSHAFSKIGDGEISTSWFFTVFDLGEDHYELGDYTDLGNVIQNFQGSFERTSLAARRGFNTNLILDSSVADSTFCNAGESPLECEVRIHHPSIAILSLGTNQVHRPEAFEAGMRRILDVLVSRHILPILSTKGDNLEGDHHINHTIACLAQEYQIPLWNFWAAIQPLPNHGLQADLEHLTYSGTNDFDDPVAMQYAWTVRNLTALQVLDEVWRSTSQ